MISHKSGVRNNDLNRSTGTYVTFQLVIGDAPKPGTEEKKPEKKSGMFSGKLDFGKSFTRRQTNPDIGTGKTECLSIFQRTKSLIQRKNPSTAKEGSEESGGSTEENSVEGQTFNNIA